MHHAPSASASQTLNTCPSRVWKLIGDTSEFCQPLPTLGELVHVRFIYDNMSTRHFGLSLLTYLLTFALYSYTQSGYPCTAPSGVYNTAFCAMRCTVASCDTNSLTHISESEL